MRIALFTEVFLPKIDGIVTRLKNTVAELRRQGDEVLIFAPGEGITDYHGAKVVRLPGRRFPLYPELTLAFPRPLIRQHLLEFKPDVIHAADPAVLGTGAIYYADVLDLPFVASYHTRLPKYVHSYGLGALEPFAWWLIRYRHKKPQINLCTSKVMFEELTEHGVTRLQVWPKAVDTELFHPRFASPEMRERLTQGNPASPLLLYVGRISPEKGIERLRAVLDEFPHARLALVGGGPHQAKLNEYFAARKAFFAGYLSGQPLAEAMASCDALILPSQTETLGLVLIEGMAAGTVAVGARAGGITDIIEDGETGFLFDPAREDGLVSVVREILSNPERMQVIRRNARTAAEQWSWSAATRQLKAIYQQAIAMPREPKRASRPLIERMVKRTAIGSIKLFLS